MASKCVVGTDLGPKCLKIVRDWVCSGQLPTDTTDPDSSEYNDMKRSAPVPDGPDGEKCKRAERKLLESLNLRGLATETRVNEAIEDVRQTADTALDSVRSAANMATTGLAVLNQATDIYNQTITNIEGQKGCRVISPLDIEKLANKPTGSIWDRLYEDVGNYDPANIAKPPIGSPWAKSSRGADICNESCESEIYKSITEAGENPGLETLFSLWDAITRTRNWTDIVSPYYDRFFNFVPWQFYIAKILQKGAGDLLEAMVDGLSEDEQEQVWEQTKCGQELIEKTLKSPLGQIDQYNISIPTIPTIPYIRIPTLLQILKNIIVDAIAFQVCCALEPLMVFIAEAMEEAFKDWMEGAGASLSENSKNLMPPLDKIDINKFIKDSVLEEAIERNLVKNGVTVGQMRDYISYVTGPGNIVLENNTIKPNLEGITQRKVVSLLLGDADCTTLNILIMVGAPEEVAKQYVAKWNEQVKNKLEEQPELAYNEEFKKTLKLQNYDHMGLQEERTILRFFEFLGKNMNIFDLLDESTDVECQPAFCVVSDRKAKKQFVSTFNNVCDLLNPSIGLPSLDASTILKMLGADSQMAKQLNAQLSSLYEMALDTLDVDVSPLEYESDVSAVYGKYLGDPASWDYPRSGDAKTGQQTAGANKALYEATFINSLPALKKEIKAADFEPGLHFFMGNKVITPSGMVKKIAEVFPGLKFKSVDAVTQYTGFDLDANKDSKIKFISGDHYVTYDMSNKESILRSISGNWDTAGSGADQLKPGSYSGLAAIFRWPDNQTYLFENPTEDNPAGRHWLYTNATGKLSSQGNVATVWPGLWKEGLGPLDGAVYWNNDTPIFPGATAKDLGIGEEAWFFYGDKIKRWSYKGKKSKYIEGTFFITEGSYIPAINTLAKQIKLGERVSAAFILQRKAPKAPALTYSSRFDSETVLKELAERLRDRTVEDCANNVEVLENIKKYLNITKDYLEGARTKFEDTEKLVLARRLARQKKKQGERASFKDGNITYPKGL